MGMFYTVDRDNNTRRTILRKAVNPEEEMPTYVTISVASKATGLSAKYIRERAKKGEIPHLMSGNTYMINYQKFVDILRREEMEH